MTVPVGIKAATQAEAEAGTLDNVGMTPLRTMQCFQANAETMVAAAAAAIEASGIVKQITHTQTGAEVHSLDTELIPLDNTKPQNTEGKEFLTHTHTPLSATNKLKIEVDMNVSNSANVSTIAALFKDSDSDALCVDVVRGQGAGDRATVRMSYIMTAGTTSAITFKVRAGCMAGYAGIITMNGSGSAQLFDGAYVSSIVVTEYA